MMAATVLCDDFIEICIGAKPGCKMVEFRFLHPKSLDAEGVYVCLLSWFNPFISCMSREYRYFTESQNILIWKGPKKIIKSNSYMNGPYGDQTHSLCVISTRS